MNISNNQDVTPYDRMDDTLLEQLLGASRFAEHGGDERRSNGQNGSGAHAQAEDVPAMACAACGDGEDKGRFGIQDGTLAALYMPLQRFDDLYDEETALKQGTLFRELDLPFWGRRGGR